MFCFGGEAILPERPAQESGLCKVFLQLEFANAGVCRDFSQVPKRVVSKRVVVADVPLYRHLFFFFFTFWFFYVLAVRRCLSPFWEKTQTKCSP